MADDNPQVYQSETFAVISAIAPQIQNMANNIGISATALAGVVAEEYDDVVQGGSGFSLLNSTLDWLVSATAAAKLHNGIANQFNYVYSGDFDYNIRNDPESSGDTILN